MFGGISAQTALRSWLAFSLSCQLLACSSVQTAGAPASNGTSPAAPAHSELDPFGVRKLYPTVPGGREWYLPATAQTPDLEWKPDSASDKVTTIDDPGVFHTSGSPRISVHSPAGKAWWRNVEMTGYIRYQDQVPGQLRPHWEFYARGERHTERPLDPGAINDGVAAPPGTITWPGYPFADAVRINPHCLGTAYHGNVYAEGEVHLEKEISHTEGYAKEVRGLVKLPAFRDPLQRWFGFKFVARNFAADQKVALEAWIDAEATGDWAKVSEAQDAGDWVARDANLNGCGAAPFGYSSRQVLHWAGPWVTFRTDSTSYDFKWFSVREIASLP